MAEDGAVIVSDPNRPISVISSGSKISQVITTGPKTSQVITSGTRGPRGADGKDGLSAYALWIKEGNQGSIEDFFASLSGGAYTHNQMVPQLEWAVQHNLGFFPNVMSFDSAGTQIVGDVIHIDSNRMIITFSHPSGGKAYLS